MLVRAGVVVVSLGRREYLSTVSAWRSDVDSLVGAHTAVCIRYMNAYIYTYLPLGLFGDAQQTRPLANTSYICIYLRMYAARKEI